MNTPGLREQHKVDFRNAINEYSGAREKLYADREALDAAKNEVSRAGTSEMGKARELIYSRENKGSLNDLARRGKLHAMASGDNSFVEKIDKYHANT